MVQYSYHAPDRLDLKFWKGRELGNSCMLHHFHQQVFVSRTGTKMIAIDVIHVVVQRELSMPKPCLHRYHNNREKLYTKMEQQTMLLMPQLVSITLKLVLLCRISTVIYLWLWMTG